MKLLLGVAILVCFARSTPESISVRSRSDLSVTVQCEDEHEPVLTLEENHTRARITCVEK